MTCFDALLGSRIKTVFLLDKAKLLVRGQVCDKRSLWICNSTYLEQFLFVLENNKIRMRYLV